MRRESKTKVLTILILVGALGSAGLPFFYLWKDMAQQPAASADKPIVAKKKPEAVEKAAIPASFRHLASEHFRASYAPELPQPQIEEALQILENGWQDLARRVGEDFAAAPLFDAVFFAQTGDFTAQTGEAEWNGGLTKGSVMLFQPPSTLRQRGILASTLRHELAHAAIESLRQGAIPRWLNEGLAQHFAGEQRTATFPAPYLTPDDLEPEFQNAQNKGKLEMLYLSAYLNVKKLLEKQPEREVWLRALNRRPNI
jgi:hypothetical protein